MAVIDLEPVRGKIHNLSTGLRRFVPMPPIFENTPIKTPSVAVIGVGRTGELYLKALGEKALVRGILRGGIGRMFEAEPDIVILATPNPTREALEEIDRSVIGPVTLVLPQNGIDVVSAAESALIHSRSQIRLVRAALFTKVTRDEGGSIVYNEDKNRIAFSPVPVGKRPNEKEKYAVRQVRDLFVAAGFKVKTVEDFRSLEWTKLLANLFGSSSTVTGLSPRETLTDQELYAMELKAAIDRLTVLQRAKIEPANVWGIESLRLLITFGWIGKGRNRLAVKFREYAANRFAGERNNQPAEAAKEIAKGERKVEPTLYYHKPFTRLAHEARTELPLDEAIIDILVRHEKGANPSRTEFSLAALSDAEKRALLLEVYGYESQDVFIKRASFLGIPHVRLALERVYEWFVDKFTVLGKENLKPVLETLKSGQSVIVAPNHRSHGDHTTVIKALRESLPFGTIRKYPIYVIAGMKFDKEDISGRFNKAYSHPVVWTLTEADVENEDIRWRAQMINGRSVLKIKDILAKKKKPCILVVYFEGGRNKEDLDVQEPVVGGGIWLLNPNVGLVVPTFIDGTQILLPPGAQEPQHADVTIEFLEAIKTAKFREEEATIDHRGRDMYFSRKVLSKVSERQKQ